MRTDDGIAELTIGADRIARGDDRRADRIAGLGIAADGIAELMIGAGCG